MMDWDTMTRVVGLQEKGYRLLQWVNDSLRRGSLDFALLHDAMTLPEATAAWMRRNYAGLPPDVRPEEPDSDAFAHLSASFLSTSFRLEGAGATSLRAYLTAGPSLRARTPDKKAAVKARQMKALCLSGLAAELEIPRPGDALGALIDDPAFAERVAYATYGRELLRRSQFASQGEGILVLWREIAWANNKPRKNFTLSADRIVAAERDIARQLLLIA